MKRLTYQLHFPRDLSEQQGLQILMALHGASSPSSSSLQLDVLGAPHAVSHRVTLPAHRQDLPGHLAALIPGLWLESVELRELPGRYAWRLWQSSSRRPLRSTQPALVSRAILSSLTSVRGAERLTLRLTLGPIRRPLSVGSRGIQMHSESWALTLAAAALRAPGELDADARAALRTKRALPAWRLVGHLVVEAATTQRAQGLASGLLGALRTAEGPGVRLGVHRARVSQVNRRPWRWNLEANVAELIGLIALPVDKAGAGMPISVQRARRLEPIHAPGGGGKLVGRAPSGAPLRLDDNDSRRNVLVSGPIGVGKSNLLLHLALQDIEHGRGVVLIDPKGDLVEDVLARYPDSRRDDLVVIDPKDPSPVGLNPLYRPDDPALAADQLLSIFQSMFDDLGPRTTDLLSAALLTLARWGEGSLAVLPLLLQNAGLRRRLVGRQPDPLGTGAVWSWFERLSEAERAQVIAPGLNKVRTFVVRPDLRAVFGQLEPRYSLDRLVRGRPVILVNTAKGLLGPTSSGLLGTLVLSQVWQQLQARSAVPIQRRPHLSIYVDELADFLRLPGDIGEILIQGRSLKASFVLAHQHLHQLKDLRPAVLANTRSKVTFAVSQDDARVFAQGHPELDALDITNLPSFSAYASLLMDNEPQPYVSLRTEPPPKPTSDSAVLRRLSRERYGRARSETDAALEALIDPTPPAEPGATGSRPRRQS